MYVIALVVRCYLGNYVPGRYGIFSNNIIEEHKYYSLKHVHVSVHSDTVGNMLNVKELNFFLTSHLYGIQDRCLP